MDKKDEKKLDADVVIFTETAPVQETANTMLAAVLMTLGVPMKCTSGNVIVGTGIAAPGGVVTWQFEPQSEDGRWRTDEIMKLFGDKRWLTDSENESPLAYIACAFHNYKRLLDYVKSRVPLAQVTKGHRKALVRLDADPEWNGVVERFLNTGMY